MTVSLLMQNTGNESSMIFPYICKRKQEIVIICIAIIYLTVIKVYFKRIILNWCSFF